MDTSETYIKMCEKAEEIQGQWKHKIGDFALNVPYNDSTPTRYIVTGQTWGKDIWLPRQDQLQEMLAIDGVPIMSVAWVGYCACLLNSNIGLKCTSMEQLWLAFVMNELHSKYWDNDKWVKKEKK